MADNVTAKDASGTTFILATDEVSSAHRPRHQISDPSADILSGSATNRAAVVSSNSLLTARPGEWTSTHAPAANTVATTTKAAGAAGVRHVCTGIIVNLVAGATNPTAVTLTVHLRDGATGAGTPLLSMAMSLAAVAGTNNSIVATGLSIVGTAATAMCLEFSAAGGANTVESVTLIGHSCSG